MLTELKYLIFGPAYLDITLEIDEHLVPGDPAIMVDQSLAASSSEKRDDACVVLFGPTGDQLRFHLSSEMGDLAATYHLLEPVLARLLGKKTKRTVIGDYAVTESRKQIGGMGAGYAHAFRGMLRMPLGRREANPDDTAKEVLRELENYKISSAPKFLPDSTSDSTLLILSSKADKLAVGVREALIAWTYDDTDQALASKADALVFCGTPNRLMAAIVESNPDIPVMCAPAMRNVCDFDCPLSDLAQHIDYLTLNALEWKHLEGRDKLREEVPAITVTEGPKGSRIFSKSGEEFISTKPRKGPVNTNRAGETYGSTFFKVLLSYAPNFHQTRQVDPDLVLRAAQIATKQAARQLDIVGFEFPPDDWA